MANKKITSAAPAAPAAPTADGYSAEQLAAEFGITSATLRLHLRALEAKKPGSRWVWPKKTDAGLEALRKQLKERLAKPKAAAPAPTAAASEAKPHKKAGKAA